MQDFTSALRGIPATWLALSLNAINARVDWRGCTKAQMISALRDDEHKLYTKIHAKYHSFAMWVERIRMAHLLDQQERMLRRQLFDAQATALRRKQAEAKALKQQHGATAQAMLKQPGLTKRQGAMLRAAVKHFLD